MIGPRGVRVGAVAGALATTLVLGVLVAGALTPGPPEDHTVGDQLLDLLAQGQQETYHARWVVRSEGPNGGDPQFSIETWRKGRDVRRDTVVQSPSSTVHTAGFARGHAVQRCERVDQDPWECRDLEDDDRASFDSLLDDVAAELEDAVVTVRRERLQGTEVDCFTIQHANDTATEYCVDLDGVVFSISNGTSRLQRLEITQGFPNAVFQEPTASNGAQPHAAIVETVTLPGLPEDLELTVTGDEPTDLRVPAPGAVVVPCADGGTATHHHLVDQELAPGTFTQQRTQWRSNVDIQADAPGADAFLQPDQSHVALTNQRGSLRLTLDAGACDATPLSWDGTTASGTGTWQVDSLGTADAFREATGSGTFAFDGSFAPGNANPFEIALDGTIEVLPPGVRAELVRAYWGHLGADYAGRVVTLQFRLSNPGPGDAFRVQLLEPEGPIGFTPIEWFPEVLGDWIPDDGTDVTLRFKVGLDRPSDHKGPLVLRRTFDVTLRLQMVDALDRTRTVDVPVTVTTPAFPPPL